MIPFSVQTHRARSYIAHHHISSKRKPVILDQKAHDSYLGLFWEWKILLPYTMTWVTDIWMIERLSLRSFYTIDHGFQLSSLHSKMTNFKDDNQLRLFESSFLIVCVKFYFVFDHLHGEIESKKNYVLNNLIGEVSQ